MNSLFAILLKNIILLALIVISLIFVFTNNIGYQEVKYIFFGFGFSYVLASVYEAHKLAALKPGTKKFGYFTDAFLTKRIIKTVVFIVCGVVLLLSQSIAKYMAFLCFLIAFTEIVVTIWRRIKGLCFVAFEADSIIICNNKLNTMHAGNVTKIEARHGITYIVDNHNNSFTIRTDMMKEREAFKDFLEIWIEANNLQDKVVLL